jgi:hypothetical protein
VIVLWISVVAAVVLVAAAAVWMLRHARRLGDRWGESRFWGDLPPDQHST